MSRLVLFICSRQEKKRKKEQIKGMLYDEASMELEFFHVAH
jgi:hypothetical protein